eukprot:TRINITY_DN2698_c0_g2_i2.p1 TRINITY_DN2698_c0_g2~~TRINITY_DN2698_c0_g2_i2.p1  ORF type:complete len:551 (+),score=78.02 TRINITY_DN2698_c0_g2_i2:82-1734(+)
MMGSNSALLLRRSSSWSSSNGGFLQSQSSLGQKPADPLLEPSKQAIASYLRKTSNATFAQDETVVKTGEDFVSATPSIQEVPAIAKEDIVALEEASPVCSSPNSTTIDCSDREVFASILRYVLKNFQDIKFYRFGKPVPGGFENTCDVSWRFRPKEGKRSRGVLYKDYRRFKIGRSPSNPCNYTVLDVGEWHSGINARKKKHRKGPGNSTAFEPDRLKPLDSISAIGETVNDSVPVVKSESSFSSGKYLMYARGGDHCKSISQYMWSFMCALGEAQYLNRTFVMDLEICLSGSYTPGHQNQEGKDFRLYFDFERLKEGASVIDQGQFWMDWNKWHKRDGLTMNVVQDFSVTPMQLKNDESTLIWRTFPSPEPDNYWYRVCEGETENVIQRPWHLIWKSKRLLEIVSAISSRMNWDFDTVHVVRGEKAQDKERWPNLDKDTSPEALLQKLRPKINESRDVYIATNELNTEFFDPLRSTYKLHFLDDFSDLWSTESEWYAETMSLSNGKPVEFDGYMRVEVDTEVFYRGKTQVDTFGYLTSDCKDGVGTCSS